MANTSFFYFYEEEEDIMNFNCSESMPTLRVQDMLTL